MLPSAIGEVIVDDDIEFIEVSELMVLFIEESEVASLLDDPLLHEVIKATRTTIEINFFILYFF